MSGDLGICLQGSHSDVKKETRYDTNLAKTIRDISHIAQTYFARIGDHPEFTRQVMSIESPNQSMTVSIAGHMLLSPRTIEKRTVK